MSGKKVKKMNTIKVPVYVLIVLTLIKSSESDICDWCRCEDQSVQLSENNATARAYSQAIYKCDGNDERLSKLNKTIELDSIQWAGANATISAYFNNLKFTYLSKILCSSTTPLSSPILVDINLDNNFIQSSTNDPFQYCTNLKTISMANNSLQRLTQDFLKSTAQLQKLNLSRNALSEFDGEILSHNKQVIVLDLSHNQITTLKINEILDASPNIEEINVADNMLFVISGESRIKYLRLKTLNLHGNKITVITSTTFSPYPNLQYLNLSVNHLSNIEHDAFLTMPELKVLDLSQNKISDVSLHLPETIEMFNISWNSLKYWPIVNIPKALRTLEVQHNQLIELFNAANTGNNWIYFLNVTSLNASHNNIDAILPRLQFPQLKTLDLSYNRFTEMPQQLGQQAPMLDWLRMNGNLMQRIEFHQEVSLRKLDFSDMPLLKELDAIQFEALKPNNGCIELTISHCPSLNAIRNSFVNVSDLCYLDLSNNNFNIIDQKWANWRAIYNGINIQGNPLLCTCMASQWLVDSLVPQLYDNKKQQHFLENLRCAQPDQFKNHHLVRYLKQNGAFCHERMISQASFKFGSETELRIEKDPQFYVIICMLAVIFALITAILVIILRRRRLQLTQRNNRRFDNGGFL